MKRARGTFVAALVFAIPASVSWGADLLTLTSPTFKDNDIWPSKYACADPGPPPRPGENVSPPLAWSNPPANTKSLALIMQDPDGGSGLGSIHWVAYDIPPTRTSITEGEGGVSPTEWVGGKTNKGDHYSGPCAPPQDHGLHHYIINIIATDIPPGTLKAGLTRDELLQALRGHAIGTASIVARYQRN